MKICFVCNEYTPLAGGGIGVFVRTMAEALVKLGVEVWVIGYGKKVPQPLIQNGVKVCWLYLPHILSKSILIQGYPYSISSLIRRHVLSMRLDQLVRSQKIDVVESYDFNGPLAYHPPCKLVVRLHGSVLVYRHGEGRPKQISPLDRYFEIKQVRLADYLIAVSQHVGETTNQVMQLKKTYDVIYNGVDTELFSPKVGASETKRILFVGNIMWRKGVFDLIRAMPLILKQFPDATLSIAGGVGGEHRERLNMELNKLEPKVLESIQLLGKVSHDDLPDLYNRASVFVFPSRVEAFGLTCAEAMACGRPVVATRLASGPELVEDGVSGLLADPTNPADLAEKINFLLDDPAMAQQLGKNARQRVLDKFDLHDLGQRNLDFYCSLR